MTAGRAAPQDAPRLVRGAFSRGATQSASGSDPQARETVEVAVPLRAAGQRYVAQFTFSRERVERIVAAAHHRLYAMVAIVGVLFYAAALPLLARLARRLPSSVDPARRRILKDLRRALDNGELRVHYQPKVDICTGTAIGVEALARWQHPARGLLGPCEFIAAAESDTRVLSRLTEQILDRAVRDCAAWRRAGRELPVAVNVSSQMVLDGPLAETVRAALERHGVEPRMLTLEVTESALMERGPDAVAVLRELRTFGVRVSIDDFGTGYSSLARLRTLPLDELKVDRSFVAGIAADERDLALVRLMIDLGSNVGLDVVAEGVEDELSLSLLEGIGCRVAQGYLLSRPLPEHELLDRVERPFRPSVAEVAV
jgi:EAL domain-containing protein (putative c-di-GMP-specific phosphodiesterase class I)